MADVIACPGRPYTYGVQQPHCFHPNPAVPEANVCCWCGAWCPGPEHGPLKPPPPPENLMTTQAPWRPAPG